MSDLALEKDDDLLVKLVTLGLDAHQKNIDALCAAVEAQQTLIEKQQTISNLHLDVLEAMEKRVNMLERRISFNGRF